MIVAERGKVLLRHAREDDLSRLDEITIVCYEPIQASFVEIVGEAFCSAVCSGRWQERKTKQVRDIFAQHPGNVWVLDNAGDVFGYVTFVVQPSTSMGVIENNGVLPEYRSKGWGTFMYRQVLQHFRDQGLRFALVETDLDVPHVPARRAYEAVGFDRQHRIVRYIQDLTPANPGSEPNQDRKGRGQQAHAADADKLRR